MRVRASAISESSNKGTMMRLACEGSPEKLQLTSFQLEPILSLPTLPSNPYLRSDYEMSLSFSEDISDFRWERDVKPQGLPASTTTVQPRSLMSRGFEVSQSWSRERRGSFPIP